MKQTTQDASQANAGSVILRLSLSAIDCADSNLAAKSVSLHSGDVPFVAGKRSKPVVYFSPRIYVPRWSMYALLVTTEISQP